MPADPPGPSVTPARLLSGTQRSGLSLAEVKSSRGPEGVPAVCASGSGPESRVAELRPTPPPCDRLLGPSESPSSSSPPPLAPGGRRPRPRVCRPHVPALSRPRRTGLGRDRYHDGRRESPWSPVASGDGWSRGAASSTECGPSVDAFGLPTSRGDPCPVSGHPFSPALFVPPLLSLPLPLPLPLLPFPLPPLPSFPPSSPLTSTSPFLPPSHNSFPSPPASSLLGLQRGPQVWMVGLTLACRSGPK